MYKFLKCKYVCVLKCSFWLFDDKITVIKYNKNLKIILHIHTYHFFFQKYKTKASKWIINVVYIYTHTHTHMEWWY